MKHNNTYWKGVEELEQSPEFIEKANAEFAEFLPVSESNPSNGEAEDNSRRDFLKLMENCNISTLLQISLNQRQF